MRAKPEAVRDLQPEWQSSRSAEVLKDELVVSIGVMQIPVPINAFEKWHQHQQGRWLIDERAGWGGQRGYSVYKGEDLPYTKGWPNNFFATPIPLFFSKPYKSILHTVGKQGKDGIIDRHQCLVESNTFSNHNLTYCSEDVFPEALWNFDPGTFPQLFTHRG